VVLVAPLIAWIYNSNTGSVEAGEPIAMQVIIDAHLPGTTSAWHGLFKNTDEIAKFYNDNKAAHPEWKAPTGNPITQAGNAVEAGQSQLNTAVGAFKGLNLETWFVRIGEILLGIVLIGVGLAKITGTANIVSTALKVVPKV